MSVDDCAGEGPQRTEHRRDYRPTNIVRDYRPAVIVRDHRNLHVQYEGPQSWIVNDAELGRREIPVGAGEVEVCVGHRTGTDSLGKILWKIPVYQTKHF